MKNTNSTPLNAENNNFSLGFLKCLGNQPSLKHVFVNGLTGNGQVNLAPSTSPEHYSGTGWQLENLPDGSIALKCLGNQPNAQHVYLNGQTGNGQVNLVPSTDSNNYSGTHWQTINQDNHQKDSYSDDFKYLNPPSSAQSNNFNNWIWELYPQDVPNVSEYADFKFKVNAEDPSIPNALCSQLIIKGNASPANYQDSEIFNNGCSHNFTDVPVADIPYKCNIPFPNDRMQTQPPYKVTNSYLDEGGMFLPNCFSENAIRNTPYYPSESYSYCLEMRIKATGQTYGTRGWGFWNTLMPNSGSLISNDYYAWFFEFGVHWDLENKPGDNEIPLVFPVALTKSSKTTLKATLLWVNYYEWHDYKIVWSKDNTKYYIDNQLVAEHDAAPPVGIQGGGMSYHCWVDNRLFYQGGYNNSFVLPKDKSILMQQFHAYPKENEINNEQCIDTITVSEESGDLTKILLKLKAAYLEFKEKMSSS